MVVAVNAVVSAGPEDVLYPRFWVGGTVNARGRVLLDNGGAVQGAGVSFLFRWVADRSVQIELAGIWDAKEVLWRCPATLDRIGTWEVRMLCLSPQRQTDWLPLEIVATPGEGVAPQGALWMSQQGQALVTMSGAGLTGVRIAELLRAASAVGVTLPGVAADGSDVQIDWSVLATDLQGVVAPDVQAVEAARVAVDADAQAVEVARQQVAADRVVTGQDRNLTAADRTAAQDARDGAEGARDTAVKAAATSSANAVAGAITVLTKGDLDALTTIPGTSPVQPLRALLLATVVSEGRNYRRNAANSAWVYESDALPAVQGRTAALEDRVSSSDADPYTAILVDGANGVLAEIGLTKLALDFVRLLAGDRPLSVATGGGAVLLDVEQDGTLTTPGARLLPSGVIETLVGQLDAGGLTLGNLLMRIAAEANGLTVADGAGSVLLEASAAGLEAGGSRLAMAGWSLGYDTDSGLLVIADPAGAVLAEMGAAQLAAGEAVLGEARARFAGLSYEPLSTLPGARLVHADAAGGVISASFDDGRTEALEAAPAGSWTAAEIATRDAAQRETVSERMRRTVSGIALCTAALSLIHSLGQSNSTGTQSGPLLTRAPRMPADLLMLGLSVRPASNSNASGSPMGDSELRPLVATMRGSGSQGNGLLTLAEGDRVPYADANEGETWLEAATHQFRRGQLAALGLDSDPTRQLVANAPGVGGTLISEHQAGGTIFARYLDTAQRIKARADALGRGSVVGAVLLDQGQWDDVQAAGAFGGTPLPDRAGYGGALTQLITDYRQQVGVGVFGQRLPPAVYLHQTQCRSALAHLTDLGVQMGQVDAARAVPGVYMIGPSYAVPDKGIHYGSNGFRQAGCQAGKVMHWTQVLRRPWPMLLPTRLERRGRQILLSYPVLHPPLVFDRPWGNAGLVADRIDKGFRALDSARADLGIAGVEIVGQTQVLVTLRSLPGDGVVNLRFADHSVGGNGFLRDSDPTRAEEVWEYLAGTTQGAAENIPDRIGAPYPLWNWGAVFHLPVTVA